MFSVSQTVDRIALFVSSAVIIVVSNIQNNCCRNQVLIDEAY